MSKIIIYYLNELNLIASLPREAYFKRQGVKNIDDWLWEMRKLQESLSAWRKVMRFDSQMEIVDLIHKIELRCKPILNKFFRAESLRRNPYLANMPVKLKHQVNNLTDRCIRKHSF